MPNGGHNGFFGGGEYLTDNKGTTQTKKIGSIHHAQRIPKKVRYLRILLVFLVFSSTALYELNQLTFLTNSFAGLGGDDKPGNINTRRDTMIGSSEPVQFHKREWDRMLFGIFTYDSPNEADIRAANRETHLSYYKNSPQENRTDLICSLAELLSNATLAQDPESCRVVYSFVMGGGVGNHSMRQKWSKLDSRRETVSEVKTRCLWEDPECGGKDITKWTLDAPKCSVSHVLAQELKQYDDITMLSIAENHELGKTDTWFTYMSMLTRQRPELQIGFVGKLDSDNLVRWPVFLQYLTLSTKEIDTIPFIYGGFAINKKVCVGKVYGGICKQPSVIFDNFVSGAMAYLSTPLAQHVYMDGTTLERKREVWIVGEDLQLGNMAYSDPSRKPYIINHRYGRGNNYISSHVSNNATILRREYYKVYPHNLKSH